MDAERTDGVFSPLLILIVAWPYKTVVKFYSKALAVYFLDQVSSCFVSREHVSQFVKVTLICYYTNKFVYETCDIFKFSFNATTKVWAKIVPTFQNSWWNLFFLFFFYLFEMRFFFIYKSYRYNNSFFVFFVFLLSIYISQENFEDFRLKNEFVCSKFSPQHTTVLPTSFKLKKSEKLLHVLILLLYVWRHNCWWVRD